MALEFFGFGKPAAPSLHARVTGSVGALSQYEEALGLVAARVELIAVDSSASEVSYDFELVAKRGETISSVTAALNSVGGTSAAVVAVLQRVGSK